MYDIFFISYDEDTADENWRCISDRLPHARRAHGIKGIHNAHKACARMAFTEMFWTIDGDTVVDDSFDFRFSPPIWDRKYLHLWYSRNPVNDLTYGYGSLKLWPKKSLLDFQGNWLDFTTTIGNIKIVDDIVATTNFNYNAYSTWKSAFREAVKLCFNLTTGDTGESMDRLLAWVNKSNPVPFSSDAVRGARQGVDYFVRNRGNHESLRRINDFEWLRSIYEDGDDSVFEDLYRNDITSLLKIEDDV